MNEDYFRVAAHRERPLLLLGEFENNLTVLLGILSCCWKSKNFCYFHSLAIVHNEARSACCARNFRYFVKLYSSKALDCRGLNLLFVVALEVVQVAKLTRLAYTLATDKALVTVKA